MNICALLATYNEERFVGACIEHLLAQDVTVYLIDNESTDSTVRIAEGFLHKGLLGIETLPRNSKFSLHAQMARKQQLAAQLDADWFMHVDADEILLPDPQFRTLAEGVAAADSAGFNVINFEEFTFIPTAEEPDHDHPRYRETLLSYYFFVPHLLRLQRLWKRQAGQENLVKGWGHIVEFDGKAIFPIPFILKHYLTLSQRHLAKKYGFVRESDIFHRDWRASLDFGRVTFPPRSTLHHWDPFSAPNKTDPWRKHYFDRFRLPAVAAASEAQADGTGIAAQKTEIPVASGPVAEPPGLPSPGASGPRTLAAHGTAAPQRYPIISVHIPKTGGGTFQQLLKKLFGSQFVQDSTVRIFYRPTPGLPAVPLIELPTIPPDVRCIHGHFLATKYDGLYPDAPQWVWLRDPVERVLSCYHNCVRSAAANPEHPIINMLVERKLSVSEFAALPTCQDMQAYMLAGKSLETFQFVGITEQYERSLLLLQRVLDLPEFPHVERVNVNTDRTSSRYPIDADLREKIDTCNRGDHWVYESGLRRFEQLCVKYGV